MPKASDILEKKGTDVVAIPASATVLQAAQRMNERRIGAVVVTQGDQVIGIFTERDVLFRIVADQRDPAGTKVEEVMTRPVACCKRSTPLAECELVMTQKKIRHLPVVEEGRLYGMVSAGDILAWRASSQATTIEYLQEYLYGRV